MAARSCPVSSGCSDASARVAICADVVSSMFAAGCGDDDPGDASKADAGADAGASVCMGDADCASDRFCAGTGACNPGAMGADARGCVVVAPCLATQANVACARRPSHAPRPMTRPAQRVRPVRRERKLGQRRAAVRATDMTTVGDRVPTILAELRSMGSERNRAGMARYGIKVEGAFRVSVTALRKIAKQVQSEKVQARLIGE